MIIKKQTTTNDLSDFQENICLVLLEASLVYFLSDIQIYRLANETGRYLYDPQFSSLFIPRTSLYGIWSVRAFWKNNALHVMNYFF